MSDRILFSIGEALIDMIPSRVGCSFDEVPAFSPRVGGAPANVCAAVARLGGRSALLSQLGDDPFGHKIARVLAGCGVELSHLEFTSKASTALAFVSLAENGQRTFSFCRKPSADLLYAPEQIDPGWYEGTNDPVPFIRYMLKIILACYAEFEQRVGLVNAEGTRSTAQQIVEHYVNGKIGRFTSAEVVAACPMIARSTVLRELKELTRKGVLQRLGTGKNTCYVRRDALEK